MKQQRPPRSFKATQRKATAEALKAVTLANDSGKLHGILLIAVTAERTADGELSPFLYRVLAASEVSAAEIVFNQTNDAIKPLRERLEAEFSPIDGSVALN